MLSFYIRDSILYLRWSIHSESFRLSTNRKIQPGYNIDKKTRLLDKKDRYALQTNSQLMRLLADAEEIVNMDRSVPDRLKALKNLLAGEEIESDEIYLSHYIRKYIDDLQTGRVKSKRGSNVTRSTLSAFNTLRERLESLAKDGIQLPLKAMDLTGVEQHKRREIADKTVNFYKAFHQSMIDDELMITSQQRYIAYLNTLITHAEKELLISIFKEYNMLSEELPIVTLTPDMVKSFLRMDYHSLPDDLKFPYELSFVILITSLRVGDAMRLTMQDFTYTDRPMIYGYKNKKTGTRTASPIPERLYSILKGNYDRCGQIYSYVDNYQVMRNAAADGMQRIMEMIPECHTEISITRLSPDGKDEIRTTMPLYKLVKPHMLRKTAITTMLYAGVDQHLIKNLSGHSGRSVSFDRYVGYVEQVHNAAILDYQSKLMG